MPPAAVLAAARPPAQDKWGVTFALLCVTLGRNSVNRRFWALLSRYFALLWGVPGAFRSLGREYR